MWVISENLNASGFSFSLQQPIAIFLCLIGIGIDLLSVGLFHRAKTTVSPFSPDKTEKLVTTGIYHYTRNPMYLGLTIIMTGLAFWLGNWGAFLVIPIFIWYVTNLQIIPEEEVLLEKFGEEYGYYVLRVRRWI